MSDEQQALRARFFGIAIERVQTLNRLLLDIEGGEEGPATVDALMREIHTLKGEARMVGWTTANAVAHRTEDVLLLARRAQRLGDATLLEHVYAGLDLLADLFGGDEEGKASDVEQRTLEWREQVEALLQAEGEAPQEVRRVAVGSPAAPGQAPDEDGVQAPTPAAPADERANDESTQRVHRRTIDAITRTAGQMGVLQSHLRRSAEEGSRLHVELERELDGLLRRGVDPAQGERLHDLTKALDGVLRSMRDVGFEVSLRQQRLQDAVESMRLARVATLFERFPRPIRDLARELGKEVRIEIEGGHVGADQQVLDALADPMLHLLRNAVDHGMEPPDNREAAGKPRRGTILIHGAHAGRFVEIRIEDDGRGIDPRAIADLAVRRGLLSDADIGRMSETELLAQIFRPAFSTQDQATDVSGRGLGLDVVKSTVEELGGNVRLESRLGQGTVFTLRLPVSIALLDALVLDVGGGVYAVPSAYVGRVLEPEEGTLGAAGGREVLTLGDARPIPLADLSELLGFGPVKAAGLPSIVVVEDGTRRLALKVERFVGEMSLVQEALDPFLKGLRVLTGTAMLDSGRRVALLNVIQLFEIARAPASPPAEARTERRAARTVLVAEDSDLTRGMLVSTLGEAGYRVLEAPNGRDGLVAFRGEEVDLVITDLEMPLLDGYALLREIRGGTRRANTPVIVFTTRDDEEEKRRAAEAGADVYLVKSAFDRDATLAVIERLLAGTTQGGNA